MVLGPHMLVGSAVALATRNPLLGIPAAILSHYLLDATPHAEYSIGDLSYLRGNNPSRAFPVLAKVSCDIGLATLTIIIAAHYGHQSPAFALAGGFAGILPDFTTFLLFIFPDNKLLQRHRAFHHKIHFPKNKRAPQFLRYGLQVIAVIVAIYTIATL